MLGHTLCILAALGRQCCYQNLPIPSTYDQGGINTGVKESGLKDITFVATTVEVEYELLPCPIPNHHLQVITATSQPGATLVKCKELTQPVWS